MALTHIDQFREIIRTENSRIIDGTRFTLSQANDVIAFYEKLSNEKNKEFFNSMAADDMASLATRMLRIQD
jgi:hypothetical protein